MAAKRKRIQEKRLNDSSSSYKRHSMIQNSSNFENPDFPTDSHTSQTPKNNQMSKSNGYFSQGFNKNKKFSTKNQNFEKEYFSAYNKKLEIKKQYYNKYGQIERKSNQKTQSQFVKMEKGKLLLNICHAKGLIKKNPKKQYSGANAGHFSVVYLDGVPIHRTKSSKNSSFSSWNEMVEVDVNYLKKGRPNKLKIQFFDGISEKVSDENAVGVCYLPLSRSISKPGEWAIDKNHKILKNKNNFQKKNSTYFGEVYVQAAYVPKKIEIQNNNRQIDHQRGIINEKSESKFEEIIKKLKNKVPNPSENIENFIPKNSSKKVRIFYNVVYASYLKPTISNINDLKNLQVNSFVSFSRENQNSKKSQIFKTKIVQNSTFPVYKETIIQELILSQQDLSPILIQVKSDQDYVIGEHRIQIPDLVPHQDCWFTNGELDLVNEKGDFTGSKLYLQAYYQTSDSKLSMEEVLGGAPTPSIDVDSYMEGCRDRGLYIVKFECFRIPDILNKRIDPFFVFQLPGGGMHTSQVYKDSRFGLGREYFVECVVKKFRKKLKFQLFDFEDEEEKFNLGEDEGCDLIAEGDIDDENVYEWSPDWGINGILDFDIFSKKKDDQNQLKMALKVKYIPEFQHEETLTASNSLKNSEIADKKIKRKMSKKQTILQKRKELSMLENQQHKSKLLPEIKNLCQGLLKKNSKFNPKNDYTSKKELNLQQEILQEMQLEEEEEKVSSYKIDDSSSNNKTIKKVENKKSEDNEENNNNNIEEEEDLFFSEQIFEDLIQEYKNLSIEGYLHFKISYLRNLLDFDGTNINPKHETLHLQVTLPTQKTLGFEINLQEGKGTDSYDISLPFDGKEGLETSRESLASMKISLYNKDPDLETLNMKKDSKIQEIGFCIINLLQLLKNPGTFYLNQFYTLQNLQTCKNIGQIFFHLKWIPKGGEDLELEVPLIDYKEYD